jgi:hypothetical protein
LKRAVDFSKIGFVIAILFAGSRRRKKIEIGRLGEVISGQKK